MRRFTFILIAGAVWTGGAQASSFVTLEAMKEPIGPSMVAIGTSADTAMATDPSIVSIGQASQYPDKAPTGFLALAKPDMATDASVSAPGENDTASRRDAHFSPMVIRGGMAGDAFVRSDTLPLQGSETASTNVSSSASGTRSPASPAGGTSQPETADASAAGTQSLAAPR